MNSLFGRDRELVPNGLDLLRKLVAGGVDQGRNFANSLFFSLLAGNLRRAEQSSVIRDFVRAAVGYAYG